MKSFLERLQVGKEVKRVIKLGVFFFIVGLLNTKILLAKDVNYNMVYAESTCYIYKKGMKNIVGVLETGNVAFIENRENHILQVKSGSVKGYIKEKNVLTGKQAKEAFEKNAKKKVKIICNNTFVYEDKKTKERIIDILTKNEEVSLIGETATSYEIVLNLATQGFVKKEEVEVIPVYEYASETNNLIEEENFSEYTSEQDYDSYQGLDEEETYTIEDETQTSPTGEQIIEYARQFLGNPYVWGGTSLTEGVDCSGFIQSVYGHFNIDLPRTSFEMRGSGVLVSEKWEEEKALPGDIICYDGHVALYCGNGTIIHAASKKTGIILSDNPNYREVLCVRRVLGKEKKIELDQKSKEILYRIVEAEAGCEDQEGKMLVARVILNRIKSNQFPDTVKKVVYARKGNVYQFSPVSNGKINSIAVSSETKEAVEKVLHGVDTSKGALYFMARKYSNPLAVKWFDSNLTYLFTHGNHEFFK